MCGIGGIYRIENNRRIDNGNMEVLFKAIESRGKDACGAAWVWADSDNKVQLFKKAIRSSNLIKNGFTTKYIGELLNFVLFHTRYATKGTSGVGRVPETPQRHAKGPGLALTTKTSSTSS